MSEKILEKVKKLLEKEQNLRRQAEETSDEVQKQSYLHEAEASATRVQKFITEYSLSEADVANASSDDRALGFVPIVGTGKMPPWMEVLFAGVIETNNCSGFFTSFGAYVCGEKQDALVSAELFFHFSRLVAELGEKEKKRVQQLTQLEYGILTVTMGADFAKGVEGDYIDSYLLGIASALASRLISAKKAAETEFKESHPDSQALVVTNQKKERAQALIKKELASKESKPAEMPSAADRAGYFAGLRMGQQIALTTRALNSKGENDADNK